MTSLGNRNIKLNYNLMGPTSYMQSVVDRNVITQLIAVRDSSSQYTVFQTLFRGCLQVNAKCVGLEQ